MKEQIKNFLYNMEFTPYQKNYILLESNPDFSDNTRAVFDEFISRGLNKKYKFIWIVDDKKPFNDIKIKNVKFIVRNTKLINKINYLYYSYKAKYIIDCNKCILKKNKKQFRIFLTHGNPVKVTENYIQTIGEYDYIVTTSDFFVKPVSKIYNVSKDKVLVTGYPRNDWLFIKNKAFEEKYKKYDKKIIWMPTYRNHKNSNDKQSNTGIKYPYGVPCINNIDELKEINSILKKNNTILILKLHPAEDTRELKSLNLSNIEIFDNESFVKEHSNVYNLLSVVDALITDYSSIYYDFLITKKQIGLAIPDIKEYSKTVKLLFDKYEGNIVGEYIYTYKDLIKFINNVINNNDIMHEERMKKVELYDKYHDNNSSKRLVDFFEKITNRWEIWEKK